MPVYRNYSSRIFCFILILLALLCFLGGCSQKATNNYKERNQVKISKNGSFELLDSSSLKSDLNLNQSLEGSFGGQTYKMHLLMETSNPIIKIVGLTTFGNKIFFLRFNGKQTQVQISPIAKLMMGANKKLDPKYMLADIELVYWPIEEIRKHLSANLKVEENQDSEGNLKRTFYDQENPIIQIQFNSKDSKNSKIYYQHLERGYKYMVENLE